MKAKCYLAAAIVSLLWVGCSQEEVGNETKGGANVIYATIEGASRSTVTDAGVFSWAEGDEISLVGQTADGTIRDTYTYSEGNAFTPPQSPEVTAPVVAYYPANESHNTTTFCLPGSYGETNTEYVANTHAAMMATPPASGNTYAFMHLGGVMRFDVKGVPAGVNEFRLMIPGKKINGHFAITANSNGEKVIATEDVTAEASTEVYVQIFFTALTEAKDMTFYVPMPTGTYGDYTVSLNNGGTYIERESTGVTNTIERRTLLLMPTFTYDATDGKLVKGEAIDQVIQLSDGNQSASLSNDAEVIVAPGTDADAVATLAYTPASDGSSTLVISDGSADGTTSGESEGKVIVETASNSTVASCDIDAPTLSVTLSAAGNGTATYTEVTANTAEQTLIIGKGVTVTTLNIVGGNVVIEEGASVGTINNEATGNTITRYVADADAFKTAFAAGSNIVLAADVDLALVSGSFLTLESGQSVSIDLNGKTLTTSSTMGDKSPDDITVKGALSIKNGSINTANTAVWANGGTLTMIDCILNSSNTNGAVAVCVDNGNLIITGGSYTGKETTTQKDRYVIGVRKSSNATINTTVSGGNGGVTVTGGSTAKLEGGSYSGVKACGLYVNNKSNVTYDTSCTFVGVEGAVVVGSEGGTVNTTAYEGYTKIQ